MVRLREHMGAPPHSRATSLHLFVQLYQPSNHEHLQRMLACIQRNACLPFVQAITVLSEGVVVQERHACIRVVPISEPMSFASVLKHASMSSCALSTHFAIANTDILLTEDLEWLLPKVDRDDTVAALSRHELDGRLYDHPLWSQDLWLFKKHSPSDDLLMSCDIRMGVAGCEHLFAMSLYCHGYNLWNPCLDCRIIHNDPSPRGEFPSRHYGNYLLLPECSIADVGVSTPAYQTLVRRAPAVGSTAAVSKRSNLQFQPDHAQAEAVKLHLCCGYMRLPGFLGVDIRASVNPDIRASVEDLGCIPSESVSEIYFCHGLEHVPPQCIETCLEGLWRVLRPGGLLRLALPDFEKLSTLYLQYDVPLNVIAPAIHGQQDYQGNRHCWSWDFPSLVFALEKSGFVDVSRYHASDFLPDSYFDRSLHVVNGVPASLNVLCVKPAALRQSGMGL